MSDLDRALEDAARADAGTRIEHRDRLASFGAAAVPRLRVWLTDPVLGAFAVRTLERIGREAEDRKRVIDALASAREETVPDHVRSDVETALANLGLQLIRPPAARSTPTASPAGTPGVPGRRYWAMRTSESQRSFIWAEVRRGRLRQGWGWEEEQDLQIVQRQLNAREQLTKAQREAWPARKMLGASQDGIEIGDLIVTQNLPREGHVSVCRVSPTCQAETRHGQ